MFRVLAFAALGVFGGGVIVALVGPTELGMTIAGVALPVLIISAVLTRIGRSLGSSMAASPASVQQARDAGRVGLARIDSLRQTGTQINDQPLCDLDLTVLPLRGSAFATTMRTIVPITAIPAFQPGTERDVAILLEGGPEVAFVDDALAPAERARLTVPARAGVPVLAVEPYTRVAGGRRKGPWLGVGRKGRAGRVVLFAGVAVVAAAVVVAPHQQALSQTVTALQEGRLRADLRQPEALAQAGRALQDDIGHDNVMSITVGADFVTVDAPLAAGDTRTDRWTYRDGQVTHDGPAVIQPSYAGEQFAWSDVAVERLWPLMQTASERTGVPIGDASARIARSADDDVSSPTFAHPLGPPTIGFTIADDYSSTAFRADANGDDLTAL